MTDGSGSSADFLVALMRPRRQRQRALIDSFVDDIAEQRWEDAAETVRILTIAGITAAAGYLAERLGARGAEVPARADQPELLAVAGVLRYASTGGSSALAPALEQASERLQQGFTDPVRRISDLALAATCAMLIGDYARGGELAARGMALVDDVGADLVDAQREPLCAAVSELAAVAFVVDDRAGALQRWRWVLQHLDDNSSPVLGYAEIGHAAVCALHGDQARIPAHYRAALLEVDAADLGITDIWAGAALAARAWLLLDAGRFEDAETASREAVSVVADPFAFGAVAMIRVTTLIAVGRYDAAERFVEEWAPGPNTLTKPTTSAAAQRFMFVSMIAVARGDEERVRRLTSALPPRASMGPLADGILAMGAGEPSRAVASLLEVDPRALRTREKVSYWQTLAAAQARLRHSAAALAALEQAAGIAVENEVALTLFYLRSDDVDRLLALVPRMGDARAAGLVRRSVPTHRSAAPVELTERERAILRLVAGGRTNAEIAAELFVSPNTVKFHLAKLFRRWGVSTREEALAIALPQLRPDGAPPEPPIG